jgi:enoyl-CoA hydratase
MPALPTVRVDTPAEGVTVVTLDRPEVLNAMNSDLIEGLHQVLDEVGQDRACRVVILTGAGRGFCSGLDLRGYGTPPGGGDEGSAQAGMRVQQRIAALVPHLRSLRQPVIAAVNGAATGGGLALALAADVRIAAESARFNVAFVRIGLSGCDIGVSWLLPRLVGASRASRPPSTSRTGPRSSPARPRIIERP